MNKFLTLTLLFISAIIFVPSVEAKTTDKHKQFNYGKLRTAKPLLSTTTTPLQSASSRC